jgi:hypothetical protein
MAWFNNIIGSNPTPPSATTPYPSGMMQSSSTSSSIASAQAGSIVAVSNGTGLNIGQAYNSIMSHQGAMYTIKNYADAIGWSITHHVLPDGVTSDDPKIAMLKLIKVGEVLKDVGVRTSDTDYYVMREPSA